MSPRRAALLATGALLLTTASWGSTFFLIKDLLERVPTLDFLAVRFAIAGVVMFAVAHRAVLAMSREALHRAVVVGGIYGVAQILQTAGLAHTAASVSGFITGMYVVCTPLLASLILRSRITGATWAAVVLATAGLGVLTLEGFSIGYGEALTFVAAVLYALHIVALGAWDALWTPYGGILLAKAVLLVAMGMLGAWYRVRLIPKLEGAKPARWFWMLVLCEVALMGLASGAASALARTSPPAA